MRLELVLRRQSRRRFLLVNDMRPAQYRSARHAPRTCLRLGNRHRWSRPAAISSHRPFRQTARSVRRSASGWPSSSPDGAATRHKAGRRKRCCSRSISASRRVAGRLQQLPDRPVRPAGQTDQRRAWRPVRPASPAAELTLRPDKGTSSASSGFHIPASLCASRTTGAGSRAASPGAAGS